MQQLTDGTLSSGYIHVFLHACPIHLDRLAVREALCFIMTKGGKDNKPSAPCLPSEPCENPARADSDLWVQFSSAGQSSDQALTTYLRRGICGTTYHNTSCS